MCCYDSRCSKPLISEKGTYESSTMHPTVTSAVTTTEYRDYFLINL